MRAGGPVSEAMRRVARSSFLPHDVRHLAAGDYALDIGFGATNSQPTTVHTMLTLLEVEPGHRVLDVGSGSAWTTALLADLVGSEGWVVGTELEPDLVAFGRGNLSATSGDWARIEQAHPGILGWPDEAPFDRILVSAMADELPESLLSQLDVGGRMVIPVAGELMAVDLTTDGYHVRRHGHYRFVPLRTHPYVRG